MRGLLLFVAMHIVLVGEGISVAIPCYERHFPYLNGLLNAFASQTRVPDEVVVSLSGCERIAAEDLDAFENGVWPFSLKLLRFYGARSAAENRNAACMNAIGDIILTNDANNLPHPQRVELVECFMLMYPSCVCLLHKWYERIGGWMKPERVRRFFLRHWNDFYLWDRIHTADFGLRKKVLRKVQWGNIHKGDVDFLIRAQRVFHKTMMIDAPLTQSRNEVSLWKNSSH